MVKLRKKKNIVKSLVIWNLIPIFAQTKNYMFEKLINSIMAIIKVNDKSYVSNSLVTRVTQTISNVNNSQIIINGVDVTPNDKVINISVEGNLDVLDVSVANQININGDVNSLTSVSGDVNVTGIVKGSLRTTSGDIECGNIGGDVNSTSGNIDVSGTIGGSVKTISGDVKYRK